MHILEAVTDHFLSFVILGKCIPKRILILLTGAIHTVLNGT